VLLIRNYHLIIILVQTLVIAEIAGEAIFWKLVQARMHLILLMRQNYVVVIAIVNFIRSRLSEEPN
jgi:hypothetical protein